VVADEAAASPGPGKGSLDHPSAGLHGEAALTRLRPDELDANRRGVWDARPGST
jgi:hypothetical protein